MLHPLKLNAGCLGHENIDHLALAIGVLDGIGDLRNSAVQCIGKWLVGMATACTSSGCASSAVTELTRLHRSGAALRHTGVGFHRLIHGERDIDSSNPLGP